jgi:Uma2 family endonuclease
MATAEMLDLMTAEEFAKRPDPGYPEELVRGKVVARSVPDRRHGFVCCRSVLILGNFVEARDLGRVLCNSSGVITERGPDSVRGADVAYYSYSRLAKGKLPSGIGPEVPELIVEVCSQNDRWLEILDKVAEYLSAGVLVVIVLDPEPQFAHIFTADSPPRTLKTDEELVVPGILEEFRVRVGEFFE